MIRRFLLAGVFALVACGANAQTISGGSTSPGGSNTQLQYNNNGALAGASGLTTDGTSVTVAAGTQTINYKPINITEVWNNAGVVFDAPFFMNVTDTASGSNSVYADIQRNGATIFEVYGTSANITGSFRFTWDGNGPVLDLHSPQSGVQVNGSGRIYFPSSTGAYLLGVLGFGSAYATSDVGISRDAAGVLDIGTGAAGSAAGSLKLTNATLSGYLATGAPTTTSGSTYTVAATDSDVICTNATSCTLTLPAAASFTGRELFVKTTAGGTILSASSNVVPLAGGAAGTAITAATAGKWARLKSDATNWIIMAGN